MPHVLPVNCSTAESQPLIIQELIPGGIVWRYSQAKIASSGISSQGQGASLLSRDQMGRVFVVVGFEACNLIIVVY